MNIITKFMNIIINMHGIHSIFYKAEHSMITLCVISGVLKTPKISRNSYEVKAQLPMNVLFNSIMLKLQLLFFLREFLDKTPKRKAFFLPVE